MPKNFRGAKAKGGKGRGKKGKAGMVGKKEMYDLIVNIDLKEWNLTDQQVALRLSNMSVTPFVLVR